VTTRFCDVQTAPRRGFPLSPGAVSLVGCVFARTDLRRKAGRFPVPCPATGIAPTFSAGR
jgi:hypothetical protein